MSTDRDVTRIVRSWLEEGRTALPDRVLDSVLDQLPATPQRRAWGPVRRLNEMNNALKFAIAAAALLVVAVVGISLLPRQGGIGSSGSGETPRPSASPSAASSQAVAPIVTCPLILVPAAGWVIDPVGGVVSPPPSPSKTTSRK